MRFVDVRCTGRKPCNALTFGSELLRDIVMTSGDLLHQMRNERKTTHAQLQVARQQAQCFQRTGFIASNSQLILKGSTEAGSYWLVHHPMRFGEHDIHKAIELELCDKKYSKLALESVLIVAARRGVELLMGCN
ncbi:uncharacterized protein Aud_007093 [Aspergillus udagawae]|uniref:Uncharacterized protein n=1 Tax=Aspergillus udagawae TaxID=91492 RepID=A0A8E0V245_9EURO|nr:uncharacterized protein Aud_007093 [Aspergillus udagawae]GIC90655.1 hypothetical protein Aud_007093 [Aspergillus udagawae]